MLLLAPLHAPPAGTRTVIEAFAADLGLASVSCTSGTGVYNCLLRFDAPGAAETTVDVAPPDTNGVTVLRHDRAGEPATRCGFYAVLSVPLAAPMDADADGIDDAFELSLAVLDPLDAADALADADGDGVCNRDEYLQGRDLTAGAVPGTASTVGLVVFAPPASG